KGLLVVRITGKSVWASGGQGAMVGAQQGRDVVADRGVAKGAVLQAKILAQIVGVRDIHAELKAVLAIKPAHGVRVLRAALVREGGTLQKSGNPHIKAVGDEDVRGQAKRVRVARGIR